MNQVIVDYDYEMTLRDGTILRSDIYRPAREGKFPVILERMPYGKTTYLAGFQTFNPWIAARRGFVVIVQDVRGRYASDGDFQPFTQEGKDGLESIEWASRLPFSDGRVSLAGGSYCGAVQWLAASEKTSALKALLPGRTGWQLREGWTYVGGAFQLGFVLTWVLGMLLPETIKRLKSEKRTSELLQLLSQYESLLERTPVNDIPEFVDEYAPYYRKWVEASADDPIWKVWDNSRVWPLSIPVLHIGGLYDLFLSGTLKNFLHNGSGQSLLLGPWSHGNHSGFFTEASPGSSGSSDAIGLTERQLDWLEMNLGLVKQEFCQVFMTGKNIWLKGPTNLLEETEEVSLFLTSSRGANSLNGDGELLKSSFECNGKDVYLYNPKQPVPTNGGATLLMGEGISLHSGPKDQREIELRNDVLVYTGNVIEQPMDVLGNVKAVLFVSTSAVDTDWTVKLCDVWPDGRSIHIADSILRMRFRESLSKEILAKPGEIYEITVEVGLVSHSFLPGHRIRLEISSSNFPRFSRNMNCSDRPEFVSIEKSEVAVQQIYHSTTRPSRLVLPMYCPQE